MSELERKDPQETPPVTYASPTMRAWAWVGVAYMVLVMLIFTYFLATGRFLYHLGGLFAAPALLGVARTAFLQYRSRKLNIPWSLCLLTVVICIVFALLGAATGVVGLMQNFGG